MTLRILKIDDVTALLKVSRPTVDRWVSESRAGRNDFPVPFSQQRRKVRWTASAIEEWIERRQAAQSPDNVPTPRQTKKENRHRQERTTAGLQRHGLGRHQQGKEEA